MIRNELLFINDILESIENIKQFTKEISKKYFIENREKQSAVIREIEIIGEAVKNISGETKMKYPEVEWRKIAGTRDILSHVYFEIVSDRIWDIIKEDLSILKKQIEKIKKESK